MNRTGTTEAIKIMQAWLDGKAIEGCTRAVFPWAEVSPWEPIVGDPQWDWTRFDYRVKPEPRVLYLAEFSNGALSYVPLNDDAVRAHANARGPQSTRLVKFVEVTAEPTKQEVAIPQTYTFKAGDEGFTEGGWPYKVISVDKSEYGNHIHVYHKDRCQMWHTMDGNAGTVKVYNLMPPGVKPLSQG